MEDKGTKQQYINFDEYIRQGEPGKRERAEAWRVGIVYRVQNYNFFPEKLADSWKTYYICNQLRESRIWGWLDLTAGRDGT